MPEFKPDEMAVRLLCGVVQGSFHATRLHIGLIVHGDGRGRIDVYAVDDEEDTSVYMWLDRTQWEALKAAIAKAEATIQQYQDAGKMRALE